MNQCDGCVAGMPIKDGIHYDKSGNPFIGCTSEAYMTNKEIDLEKLKKLPDGSNCTINWFEESGGLVYNCNGVYVLFEVGLYGGNEHYHDTYKKADLQLLVDKAYSWT